MLIDTTTRVQRNRQLLTSNMDDEIVMLSLENGEYYGINAVWRRIWELIDSPMALADISAALQSEFDVTPSDCTRDVVAFVRELAQRQIVTIA